MARLVYVGIDKSTENRRYPYVVENDVKAWKLSRLNLNEAILVAVIKRRDEPSHTGSTASGALMPALPELTWREPIVVSQLEIIVSANSQFTTHEPLRSDSPDSDALYFGENDEHGMLLQYIDPLLKRTVDPVAHTSVHHHEKSSETYHVLHGAAAVEMRHIDTRSRKTVPIGTKFAQIKVTVPPYVQHPVVARYSMPSVMLIVTTPPNNSRDDHHYDGLFKDLFHDVIASYTQRTHGPSATGLIGGSQ